MKIVEQYEMFTDRTLDINAQSDIAFVISMLAEVTNRLEVAEKRTRQLEVYLTRTCDALEYIADEVASDMDYCTEDGPNKSMRIFTAAKEAMK